MSGLLLPNWGIGPFAASAQVASEASVSERPDRRTYELNAGADAFASGWTAYAGVTAALYGDVRDSGWRVRSSASYGAIRYTSKQWNFDIKKDQTWQYLGRHATADVLVGYQYAVGPATIKAFIGGVGIWRSNATADGRTDEDAGWLGDKMGLKLAIETWTRFGDWGFLQIDGNWSEPTDTTSGRLRIGYRLSPAWSAGLEAAAYGDPIPDQGRAGIFGRFEWGGGEISLSAGASGDQDTFYGAYGTFNTLVRF